MSDTSQRLLLALIVLFFLLLAGCASTQAPTRHEYQSTATFPVPDEIQANVDFWSRVYGKWKRSQVAIHDEEHLGLIYEVTDLPGVVRGRYTPEQKRFLDYRLDIHRSRLSALERKVRSGTSLSSSERELYDRIADAGGTGAVYGASERLRLQRGLRERFRRGVEISGRYEPAFREIFRAYGLPEDLAYLPHVESSYQVNARSSAGAAGIWQFMPATARLYMTVNAAVDERLDPIIAADGAARYLDGAYRKLGSWPLAITSYNHGQGGMLKAKDRYGSDIGRIVKKYQGPYFGFASRNFYAEFLAAREVAGNPHKYFPEGVAYERPLSYDQLVLRYSMPAHHLARHYGVSVYRLQNINLAWRAPVLDGRAAIPAGSKVWLPPGSLRLAGEPGPVPVLVASAEPRPEPAVAKATARRPAPVVAKAEPKPVAARKASASSAKVQVHVVKPNETLYRVALRYDMTVQELKKLNRLRTDDDTIRAGQRLRVNG